MEYLNYSLPNDGPYTRPEDAVEEYKETELFYVKITTEMGDDDIEYMQENCMYHFRVNLPKEYIIEMLTRDSMIATEVFNRAVDDTDARDKIRDYMAAETLNTRWPGGTTSPEDSKEFFEKFNEMAISRQWNI